MSDSAGRGLCDGRATICPAFRTGALAVYDTAMITLYGLKTCDTVRKARTWLDARGIAYAFHDFRADGLPPAVLDTWLDALGWDKVLNRQSTSFKALSSAEQADLDRAKVRGLILANPTLVKRPVLDRDGAVSVGFKPELYAAMFGGKA